ncbi:unnamed protein product [Brachionus calyciflorus]|uniref:Uncharacterized protein n=1 Tax=Brachionus calyciflorus TaxID=104777 RepID=A0A814MC64_9BILA|nr:unnamed protein product [Brachionus calyciflorus]
MRKFFTILINTLNQQLNQSKIKQNEQSSQVLKLRTEYDRLFSEYTLCCERFKLEENEIKMIQQELDEVKLKEIEPSHELNELRNRINFINIEFNKKLKSKEEQIIALNQKNLEDSRLFESSNKSKITEIDSLKNLMLSCNKIELTNLKQRFDLEYDCLFNQGLNEMKIRDENIRMLQMKINDLTESLSLKKTSEEKAETPSFNENRVKFILSYFR